MPIDLLWVKLLIPLGIGRVILLISMTKKIFLLKSNKRRFIFIKNVVDLFSNGHLDLKFEA